MSAPFNRDNRNTNSNSLGNLFKQALNACANKLYTSDAGPLAGQERTLFNQFTWNSDWLELYSMPRPPSIGENKFKSASQDIIIIMDTILMS